MQFLDTNIFIRHLTGDDMPKARACLELFLKVKHNKTRVTTSESVIAEVVYVLSSKQLYNLSRDDIRARLYPILTLPGMRLPHRSTFLRALDLYTAHTIDFTDALCVAHMERESIEELLSYDRDFDHVTQIVRLEP